MSPMVLLLASCSMLPAQAVDAHPPGEWIPYQVGLVQQAWLPRVEWQPPRVRVALRWRVEDPGALLRFTQKELYEVLIERQWTLEETTEFALTADREPLTCLTQGPAGYADYELHFAAPDVTPEQLRLTLRSRPFALEPFTQEMELTTDGEGAVRFGDVTFRLDRSEVAAFPPASTAGTAEVPAPCELRPGRYDSGSQADRALVLTFRGDGRMEDEVSRHRISEAILTGGGVALDVPMIQFAQSLDGDTATYLYMWVPGDLEALPGDARLRTAGQRLVVSEEALAETAYDLPVDALLL